jgi:glycogen debranching enzyme
MSDFEPLPFPEMRTSNLAVNRAYRIAMGDLIGNVRLFQDGLLERPAPVLLAGLDYDTPWTRDASINVWNGLSLLWPDVAQNTLLSVLDHRQGQVYIGGQYWDAIIWAIGAWAHYLHTGDRAFLPLAFDAVKNSLAHFEREEFDKEFGLFRGPAVYGDGVAAYPDRYSPGGTSFILDWVKANEQKKAPHGFGMPMLSLSTNCVYAEAYRIAGLMARERGDDSYPAYEERARQLVARIRERFWNSASGTFNYLFDADGACDHQEGLGHAFAILFGVASDEQAASVLAFQHITDYGIPCVWPTFPRYSTLGGYGRHSGTVWPFISGFWGEAALTQGRADLFAREFSTLTENIVRSAQCAEIHHPDTGEVYGGLQEMGTGPHGMDWSSCRRQSWTASAYLRMILTGLFGMQFSAQGIRFAPCLPHGVDDAEISGLRYRDSEVNIMVEGHGRKVAQFQRNDTFAEPFLPADAHGKQMIRIQLLE